MASFPGQKSTGPALPNQVVGLTAVAQSGTSVGLTWTAVANATSYNVLRGGALLEPLVLGTSFTDGSVVANTTYTYTVEGVNTLGVGAASTPATVTTPPVQVTGLTATPVSTTEIDLAWTTVAGAVTYNVRRAGTVIASPSTNSYHNTGLTPATQYSYTASAVGTGGEGAQSAAVLATTQSSGGSLYKFTPGHWLDLSGAFSSWQSQINTAASLGFKGAIAQINWNQLEFAEGVYTSGSVAAGNAGGFAMIDQVLAWCQTANIKFGILYSDRTFFQHTYTTPDASICDLPEYFNTVLNGGNGYILAPSGTTWGGLGGIALDNNATVMDRHIALMTAYGARYDSNPTFESWNSPETAVAAGNAVNSDYANYVVQWGRWCAAAHTAFPTSEVRLSTNYAANGDPQMLQLITAAVNAGCSVGGPDNFIPYAGNQSNGAFNSAVVYKGTEAGVGPGFMASGMWVSEAQFPDVVPGTGHEYPSSGGWACTDVWNFWTNNVTISGVVPTPNPTTWGGIQPHKYIWFYNQSTPGVTTASVGANIKNMPTRTTIPTSYQ